VGVLGLGREYRANVDTFGRTFRSASSTVINILGFNSPEWFMANCGRSQRGGVAAGIYATNLPDATVHL
jgi:long-chain-fatty-acid--CoA ligase ACSBG